MTKIDLSLENNTHLLEQKDQSQEMFRGNFLNLHRDTVKMPNGSLATRDYFAHPGAAVIIALTANNELVLEKQFRYPVGQVLLEFPAGKLDPKETDLDCAKRELLEETGYVAQQWAKLPLVHLAPAYCTEELHIFVAKDLQLQERALDEGELIDIVLMKPAELFNLCYKGQVSSAVTLTTCFWLQAYLSGQLELNWQN